MRGCDAYSRIRTMIRSEEKEQARLITWSHRPDVRAKAGMLAYLFHCPNGGKRDPVVGGQMRALGVKPGVPDLLLPHVSGEFNGLAIEMKSAIGTTTPDQDRWLETLKANGWLVHVCRSAQEARSAIVAYLGVDLPELAP
jgi:hypothetical protein